jgi:PAS domain S-box-containing protein
MTKLLSYVQRFSTQLVLAFLVLIVITTLSAGAPAYWITSSRLEQQTWTTAENARQATLSLLQAEQERLRNLALLFAQRPTLQRLLDDPSEDTLPSYVQAFQEQSRLDLLFVCDPNGEPLAGAMPAPACLEPDSSVYALVDAKPALLVSQSISDDSDGQNRGSAVAGIWLDDEYMNQMAASTGAQHSLLRLDGAPLASSISQPAEQNMTLSTPRDIGPLQVPVRRVAEIGGRPYFLVISPLMNAGPEALFLSEVALPVDALRATERRALAVLVTSTGLVALLGLVFAIFYIRHLTRPLRQLTQAAVQISRGDLIASIPKISTPAEVATLAAALEKSQNTMLSALDERSQARDWLATLIRSMVEGVVTFDTYGRVTFLNQGAELLTGWNHKEATGRHVNELFLPADDDGLSFLDQIPARGKRRQIETRTRAGKLLTLSATGARLVPPNSDTVQMALVLRDVTSEEALRHLHSYFLANVSHEFKTPLTTLNASIELLLDSGGAISGDELVELLKPAHLSLLSLQNLINNLLESSRIEAGAFSIRRRAAHLNQIITDALRLVQPVIDRRRQSFHLIGSECLENLPLIEADAVRLTQVVVNLLANASKYSPIGGPIELTVEQLGGAVRLSVADRGRGIPADERINLFRRFVRLDTDDDEQYGIGLGLYVVKTTVEAHGGRLGVENRLGGGSIFWIELPLVAVSEPA